MRIQLLPHNVPKLGLVAAILLVEDVTATIKQWESVILNLKYRHSFTVSRYMPVILFIKIKFSDIPLHDVIINVGTR
jgi:hypothetical protein